MARGNLSVTNYLKYSAALVTAVPFTISAWTKMIAVGSDGIIFDLHATGSASARNTFKLYARGSSSDFRVEAGNGSTNDSAGGPGTISAGNWYHTAGVFTNATTRRCYVDGVVGGAGSSTNLVPSGINEARIGVEGGSAPGKGLNGYVADVAVWDIALSATEIARLAAGANPMTIRPDALVAYWPLMRASAQSEPNMAGKGSYRMANNGTVGTHPHPPKIIMPKRRLII